MSKTTATIFACVVCVFIIAVYAFLKVVLEISGIIPSIILVALISIAWGGIRSLAETDEKTNEQESKERVIPKQQNDMAFSIIDTNIHQFSNDEDIKNYLCQKQVFRQIYEALLDTPGTQLYAQLLGSSKSTLGIIAPEVYELIVIVKYESATQFGQWDLLIIQKPVSKETNIYKVVSYLEKSMNKDMDEIIEYLREEIQFGINKDIQTERKITVKKHRQIIMNESNDNFLTNNHVIYFSLE